LYGDFDLMRLEGSSYSKYARNLVKILWDSDEIKSHSFRDNSEMKSIGREAFSSEQDLEKMELLKGI
jgi:hypothetical protein